VCNKNLKGFCWIAEAHKNTDTGNRTLIPGLEDPDVIHYTISVKPLAGLEPATLGLKVRCSNQLSYRGNKGSIRIRTGVSGVKTLRANHYTMDPTVSAGIEPAARRQTTGDVTITPTDQLCATRT
jgi:hypothetical protein